MPKVVRPCGLTGCNTSNSLASDGIGGEVGRGGGGGEEVLWYRYLLRNELLPKQCGCNPYRSSAKGTTDP